MRCSTCRSDVCSSYLPPCSWSWGRPLVYYKARRPAALSAYAAVERDAAFFAARAPGSPAARAGLHVGYGVAWVDMTPIANGIGDHPFARITALEQRLAARPTDAAIWLGVTDGRTVPLTPKHGSVRGFRRLGSASGGERVGQEG